MMKAEMQKIVYDPVSWIHPQRFSIPAKLSSPRCKRILNDMIFSQYALSHGGLDIDNGNERYLAKHWSFIPRAAFMAVCQRYRASLAYYGQLARLDTVTRQFALLELVNSKDEYRERIGLEMLSGLAHRELEPLSHGVSRPMKERLPLLFPEPSGSQRLPSYQPQASELLLRMAIQHAKRNP